MKNDTYMYNMHHVNPDAAIHDIREKIKIQLQQQHQQQKQQLQKQLQKQLQHNTRMETDARNLNQPNQTNTINNDSNSYEIRDPHNLLKILNIFSQSRL